MNKIPRDEIENESFNEKKIQNKTNSNFKNNDQIQYKN